MFLNAERFPDPIRENGRPKLFFFVTEDWFFYSHFLDRAVAAREAGYRVAVICRVHAHADAIVKRGIEVIPIALARTGMHPGDELRTLAELLRIYRRERPDIVHHVAVKPILYGTLAARLTGVRTIVNAPVGLGYVFSSQTPKARLLRPFVLAAYRLFMNPRNGATIFENPDDPAYFAGLGVVDIRRCRLIRGAGVDMGRFYPFPEPKGVTLVVLASRLLWDKGVGEFVEAARLLRSQGVRARFVLVGEPDHANPAAVPESQLNDWREEGVVEFWGRREDMPEVFAGAHIVCLPSYREGLPKVLIEAAAAGRPIVTTDTPGCREIVREGENGLLVPVKSVEPLAAALRRLIEDPDLRLEMGRRGRAMAVAGFSVEQVNTETLALYRRLLHRAPLEPSGSAKA